MSIPGTVRWFWSLHLDSPILVCRHSRGTSLSKFTPSQGGSKRTSEGCLSHTRISKQEVKMTTKARQSLKEKFVVKNSLVKAFLSEFLGTFILIVSDSGFLPSWQGQPDRLLFGHSARGAGQSMRYVPISQPHTCRGWERAQFRAYVAPMVTSQNVAVPGCVRYCLTC